MKKKKKTIQKKNQNQQQHQQNLLEQRLSGFVHLAGQPSAIRAAFVEAFGLRGTHYEPG
jgi:hypothetical protein